jgi:cytochrome b involved in lipid metabolism
VDTRCIITIDGTKYNVTDYRYQHPGGDVFQCGTDMSVAFHNQHNPRTLDKIQNLIVP